MRILQIGKFWPVLGGVEKVMLDLTRGLSARNIECDMLCAAADGAPRVFALNSCGNVIAVRTLLKASGTMIAPQMVSVLRRIAPRYDIIHVHHPDPMAALALFLSGYKGKVVLHWHSDILRQRLLLQAYRPLQRWLLRRADRVICTSPRYAEGSGALRSVADKLECVPIGVAPVIPDPDAVDQVRRQTRGKRIIFSLGRMVPYKGFDSLIAAASRLPDDYLVVIAGSGPLHQSLSRLVDQRGLAGKVIMPGRISDRERDAWIGAASVFCLPSVEKTEAYGVVLVESMSAGLPVVATEIPGSGTSWVNAHGVSGLNVPCSAPDKLAEALIKVADGVHSDEFRVNARRRWESMFTIDAFIDNITALYLNLAI